MRKDSGNRKRSSLAQVLGGDMLGSHFVLKMVAIRYRVESLNKQKDRMKKEVSYLHEHRVQMQKQYQESIRISRIDRELDTVGVGLVAGPPFELRTDK